MAKRVARPGLDSVKPGPFWTRPVLGLARQTWLENWVGPFKPTGSFLCPSPARSGPKRAGKHGKVGKNGLSGLVSTVSAKKRA